MPDTKKSAEPLPLPSWLPANPPAVWMRTIGTLLGAATIAYIALLLFLLAALEWVGERNWVLSVLLYLPAHLWLLPLAGLTPLCLIFRRSLVIWHAGCLLFVVFVYMTFRWSSWPVEKGSTVTFVTNNIGQNNHQSLQPFVQAENPEVIALQDAGNRGFAYAREYPGRFVQGCGEFVLISKLPIRSAGLLDQPRWLGQPVAARYELSFNGKPFVVYNVHLPTPRPDFQKLHGTGLFREILGPDRNRRRSDNRSYAESMSARVELAGELARQISGEKLPFVVMGDFNMPDHGCVYHLVASRFTDAFAKRGRGWGLTFPGYSSHAFVFFGPWLRLDYLFAGTGWRPVYCRAEPSRTSQHRAVAARFELADHP